MTITNRPPVVFVEGRGSWLRDQSGKDYLDFIQGWAVNCLGHCPDAIVKAMTAQASRLLNCSPSFYNEPMIRLAELIAHHSGLQRTFFTNSGAEAVEGAIKLARKWGETQTRRRLRDHHHGSRLPWAHARHHGGLRQGAVEGPVRAESAGISQGAAQRHRAVERAITPNTVAVMLEPIQGEAGVFDATDQFLRELRDLTKRAGILLILDEIQTGIGRTGKFFAFEHAGIAPDIMALGKGLGGGIPLAALVAREDVCCFAPGDQGGTFNGNAFSTAVGCAVMEEIAKPGFLPRVAQTGIYLTASLETLARKHGCGGVRGRGLLLALDLKREIGSQVAADAFERGLLINAPRPDSLRFMPALTVTREEIDQMTAILDAVLESQHA